MGKRWSVATAFAALSAALAMTNGAAAPATAATAGARGILLKGAFAITGTVVISDLEGTPVGTPYDRTWTFIPDPKCTQSCTPIPTDNRRPDGRVTDLLFFRAKNDGSEYQGRVLVTGGSTCRHNGKIIFKMAPKGWTGWAHFRLFVTKSKIMGTKTPIRLATRLEGIINLTGSTTEQFDKACGKTGPPFYYKAEFAGTRKP